MSKKRIAAVVTTFNRADMLLQCIAALEMQQGAVCDILVIDNASTDDTYERVKKLNNVSVFYYNTGANLGGAGGFNIGMRLAVERGYDRVWIMDDDTLPELGALRALCDAEKHLNGKFGFLSSIVLWTDGGECRMNRQPVSKKYFEHLELMRYGMIAVKQATFVSLYFSAEVIRTVGLPLKEYFIWGDDIEYTRRIADRGDMPCYMVGQSCVVHAMKSNTGSDIALDGIERIGRYRYAYRNENYTYRQRGFVGVCYYLARCGKHLLRVWRYAPDHRLKRTGIIFFGMMHGCFFHPKVEFPDASQPEKDA